MACHGGICHCSRQVCTDVVIDSIKAIKQSEGATRVAPSLVVKTFAWFMSFKKTNCHSLESISTLDYDLPFVK